MFKYKLITIILLILISCNTPNKDILQEEEDSCLIKTHDHVLSRTDSILVLADKEFKVIKQKQIEQNVFVDSLRFEIYTEQNIISDIQTELNKRMNVEVNLQVTRQELEEALIKCEKKEKKVSELKEKLALKSEKFMDEKVYLINFYNNKVDSLKDIIMTLTNTPIIDTVFLNKRNYRKQNNQ